MSYIMGQATCPSTGTVPLFTVPAGLCNVTFWNVTAGNVYIGTSSAKTTVNNGLQCHSIPTNFFTYVGSAGATFFGVTNGTAATVNYIICNNF